MSMVSEDDPVTVLMCCHWVMHSSALNDGRYLLTILFIGVLGVDLMWRCIEDRVLVYRFVVSLISDNQKTKVVLRPSACVVEDGFVLDRRTEIG
ncbi:hypothetical protein XFHB_08630 [Xylella fastidiosa]|uniref:Transmembrane protein n=1 Tax=Xylella fastidiosa TaxID=2371 RepID=A0ABC8AEQ1_XYLFS|nr:hypothetical protein [Xylella fastidiosa]ALR06899.1 hypothetical protein XFHB_08630 [Xylella fastidiosa]